jgi:hypothetical protein
MHISTKEETQQTREPAAMRQHQRDDLGESQREGKDQPGAWRNGTSFGLTVCQMKY